MSYADAEEVKFSLKVVTDKEKTKVLFAESDGCFVDVMLSFLTLPLGRLVKVLEKHYGDEAPVVGCLNTLYNSVSSLDSSYFSTEGAKLALLNPTSSFDKECHALKLNIIDTQRKWFYCEKKCPFNTFWSESIYYDKCSCTVCNSTLKTAVAKKRNLADGTFTLDSATFIITDDLLVMPSAMGFVKTISNLVITGMDNAELMDVSFGLSEVMDLLTASMISRTPLSDLLLNKMNPVQVESLSETPPTHVRNEENPNSKKIMLKVTVQKSTNRLLFAQANEDFVEFLFTLLAIPLGGVECLLASKTSIRSIDNLYRSVTDLIDDN